MTKTHVQKIINYKISGKQNTKIQHYVHTIILMMFEWYKPLSYKLFN